MKMRYLLASATALFIASSANAATITKSYIVNSTFSTGSIASLTQKFTLTFDPFVNVVTGMVSNYNSSSNLPALNVPLSFDTFNQSQFGYGTGVTVGGKSFGAGGIINGTDDFSATFYVDADGSPYAVNSFFLPRVSYSIAGSQAPISSTSAIVTLDDGLTGAVPEPATWAMMVVGFGAAGAALRRRKQVAIAFA